MPASFVRFSISALIATSDEPPDMARAATSSAWPSGCVTARAARRTKILAFVPPVFAFVAAGFKHSLVNLFLLPFGLAIKIGAPAWF
jgi:hypothetical protein